MPSASPARWRHERRLEWIQRKAGAAAQPATPWQEDWRGADGPTDEGMRAAALHAQQATR